MIYNSRTRSKVKVIDDRNNRAILNVLKVILRHWPIPPLYRSYCLPSDKFLYALHFRLFYGPSIIVRPWTALMRMGYLITRSICQGLGSGLADVDCKVEIPNFFRIRACPSVYTICLFVFGIRLVKFFLLLKQQNNFELPKIVVFKTDA